MRNVCHRSFGFILLLMLTVMLESCAGCTHRSRRARERHRDRVERHDGSADRLHGRDRNADRDDTGNRYSSEHIQTVADGDDYDAMLDCQFGKLNEIKRLKEEYFRGDMPDKEVKDRMQAIEDKYSTVDDALKKAEGEGLLTYNQHKRQMKLMGDYLKEVASVGDRLGSDISSLIDL